MDKDNISAASSIRSFLDPLWSTPRAPVPNNVEFLGNIDEMDFVPLSWDVPVREAPVNARQNCSTSRRSLLGAIFLATVVAVVVPVAVRVSRQRTNPGASLDIESASMAKTPTTQAIGSLATRSPSEVPTSETLIAFTDYPSAPSYLPTVSFTEKPVLLTPEPTNQPSTIRSDSLSDLVTRPPVTGRPSTTPTNTVSELPSLWQTGSPSANPSTRPSHRPSQQPTVDPSEQISRQPSAIPSLQPTATPSGQPSLQPTVDPSEQISRQPSVMPSLKPTANPSYQPSTRPSSLPTVYPSSISPSSIPTAYPSFSPQPSMSPSNAPTQNFDWVLDWCRFRGGGQAERCYTDNGIPKCSSTMQTANCWPELVPCEDFGDFSIRYGICGTERQGGSRCFLACQQANQPTLPPVASPTSFPTSFPMPSPSALPSTSSSSPPTARPSSNAEQRIQFDLYAQLVTQVDFYLNELASSGDPAQYQLDNPMGNWDVSRVDHFRLLFSVTRNPNAKFFNHPDVSSWNTASADNLSFMFEGSAFNQPLSNFNTSAVINMEYMFFSSAFNQDLSNFDTRNVKSMAYMFSGATDFNGDLSSFDTSEVIRMEGMFQGASSFNREVSNFDTSRVTDMKWMFNRATAFNQDLSSFKTNRITDMSWMFNGASSFNTDLSGFDTSAVTAMSSMFNGATAFNRPLTSFDTSRVTDFNAMFSGATAFNQDVSTFDIGSATQMTAMFFRAASFNQDLCSWGSNINPAAAVSVMFTVTSCPSTISTPVISAVPPGPFCYTCN